MKTCRDFDNSYSCPAASQKSSDQYCKDFIFSHQEIEYLVGRGECTYFDVFEFLFNTYCHLKDILEPLCCKKWQKILVKILQYTGLGNRGLLEALNDTKLILDN